MPASLCLHAAAPTVLHLEPEQPSGSVLQELPHRVPPPLFQNTKGPVTHRKEHCIQAGPDLHHGIHLLLDLQQVAGGSPAPLGDLGDGLAGILAVCLPVCDLAHDAEAAGPNDLARGVSAAQ